jgi:hypothetical protein
MARTADFQILPSQFTRVTPGLAAVDASDLGAEFRFCAWLEMKFGKASYIFRRDAAIYQNGEFAGYSYISQYLSGRADGLTYLKLEVYND